MSAGIYNFTIEQGTYFKRTFTWKDAQGAPINITGYTPHMQIRTPRDQLILNCDDYLAIDGAAGKVTMILSDEVTGGLDFDTAKFDIKLDGPQPRRLIKGQVTLDPATTE